MRMRESRRKSSDQRWTSKGDFTRLAVTAIAGDEPDGPAVSFKESNRRSGVLVKTSCGQKVAAVSLPWDHDAEGKSRTISGRSTAPCDRSAAGSHFRSRRR